MSWLGKMIGGTIGFALGGPLGAVAGAAFGHTFVDKKEQVYLSSRPNAGESRSTGGRGVRCRCGTCGSGREQGQPALFKTVWS